MLVLSRTENESVMLGLPDGSTFEVVIVELQRGKVRLGFIGHGGIPILRKELYESNGNSFAGCNPKAKAALPPRRSEDESE